MLPDAVKATRDATSSCTCPCNATSDLGAQADMAVNAVSSISCNCDTAVRHQPWVLDKDGQLITFHQQTQRHPML